MRTISYLVLSSVAAAGVLSAATYTADFDSPAYTADADPGFDGVDGWTQSSPNPTPDPGPPVGYVPYAWITTSFSSGNAAAYGSFYDVVPDGFTVGRQYTGLLNEKSLSFQNHITDATPIYEGRDTFGFTLRDGGGDLLLTVSLIPVSQDLVEISPGVYESGLWSIHYAFGTDTLTSTGNAVQATAVNFFAVDFGQTGLTFRYGNGTTAQHGVSGTAAGYDVNDGTLNLDFTYGEIGAGDNYIRIDNITLVDQIPEPSAAALVGFGALALLRRRRA